jgi:uncharacterized membrane protein
MRAIKNKMMKKLIITIVIISLPTIYGFTTLAGSEVYICVSKTASKYHFSQNCKGLSRCTHTITKVSLTDAKAKGYSLCGWED